MDSQKHTAYTRVQISFRLVTALTTFTACLLMALNKQTNQVFDITASYKSSPAFKFFVIGNALVCGYSLLSLPCAIKSGVEGYALPVFDLVSMGVSMASGSAATAIAYVGKNGNEATGWARVCPYFHKFCDRVGISLLFSFLGFLTMLMICSYSSMYKTRLIKDSA